MLSSLERVVRWRQGVPFSGAIAVCRTGKDRRQRERDTPLRCVLVFALAVQRCGGGGGVSCEECLPLSLALWYVPERAVHLVDIPAPRACERGHVRGVEPGGNGGLGHALLAPAQDMRHDGLPGQRLAHRLGGWNIRALQRGGLCPR